MTMRVVVSVPENEGYSAFGVIVAKSAVPGMVHPNDEPKTIRPGESAEFAYLFGTQYLVISEKLTDE